MLLSGGPQLTAIAVVPKRGSRAFGLPSPLDLPLRMGQRWFMWRGEVLPWAQYTHSDRNCRSSFLTLEISQVTHQRRLLRLEIARQSGCYVVVYK